MILPEYLFPVCTQEFSVVSVRALRLGQIHCHEAIDLNGDRYHSPLWRFERLILLRPSFIVEPLPSTLYAGIELLQPLLEWLKGNECLLRDLCLPVRCLDDAAGQFPIFRGDKLDGEMQGIVQQCFAVTAVRL